MNLKLQTALIFLFAAVTYFACGADAPKLPDIEKNTMLIPTDQPVAPVVKNTVNLPAPINTINVPPAANTINVPLQETDWKTLAAQIGALWSALIALYHFVKLHHAELAKVSALEDFVAYCYQNCGTGPNWIDNAFGMVGREFNNRFGKNMTDTQWTMIKHALAALHLEVGLPKKEEDPDIMKLENAIAALKAKKNGVATAVVTSVMVLAMMLVLPGCLTTTTAAQKTVAQIKSDNVNLVKNCTATAQGLANYYLAAETNRENVRYACALKSVTHIVQVVGGTTINHIDPNTQAGLTREHETNLALVQSTYNSIELRISAMTADSPHIAALADSLTSYLAGATANNTTIQQSATEVLNLVTSLTPAAAPVSPAPVPKAQVLP